MGWFRNSEVEFHALTKRRFETPLENESTLPAPTQENAALEICLVSNLPEEIIVHPNSNPQLSLGFDD